MKIRLSLLLLVASSLPPISCSQEGRPSSKEVSVAEPPAGATGGHLYVTKE